jgi:hypothetical protein
MRQVPSSRISTNPISAKDRRSGSQHPEERFEGAYDVVDAAEAAPRKRAPTSLALWLLG